jgi:hypothetical protein
MSSFNLTIMKNEHWICLLSQWRRFCSMISWILRSRSHIIHVLLITSFFDFFVRFRTTAYSFESTRWLIARRRFFRKTKLRFVKDETRFMIEWWWLMRWWVMIDEMMNDKFEKWEWLWKMKIFHSNLEMRTR